jgi:GTP-binding protein
LSAEFVTSAGTAMQGIPRDGLPQIAIAGRSNVGKSSLINALVRQKIARTSAAPGKTRLANVYRIVVQGLGGPGEWSFYLVDLPGYGYARGGSDSVAELRAVAEAYFGTVRNRVTFLLVDSRHPGLEADVQAHQWLTQAAGAPQIVATKVDKLTRAERVKNLRDIEKVFGMAALPVSAESGEGLSELWQTIRMTSR